MNKVFIIVIILSGVIFPQRLSYNLTRVAAGYAEAYITPFVSAFGANFNSAIFTNSPPAGKLLGVDIYLGVKGFGTFVPPDDKSFNIKYNEKVDYFFQGIKYQVDAEVTVNNAPTVFGSAEPARAVVVIRDTIRVGPFTHPIEETRNYETFGGIFSTDFTGLGVPHLEVGSIFGTSAMLRYLPPIKILEYGDVYYIGFGLNHNIAQYLKELPVNITFSGVIQQFGVKDSTGHNFIKGNTFAGSVIASKEISIVQLYGGLQYEEAFIAVDYTYNPPPSENDPNPQPIRIDFDMKGRNNIRFILGASVNLGPVALNLDYNLAKYSTISGGLGILLRF